MKADKRKQLSEPLREPSKLEEDEQQRLLRKWTGTNRYLNLLFMLSDPEPVKARDFPRLPRKRLSQDDRDALLTAGLALLVIAAAAFAAGLL